MYFVDDQGYVKEGSQLGPLLTETPPLHCQKPLVHHCITAPKCLREIPIEPPKYGGYKLGPQYKWGCQLVCYYKWSPQYNRGSQLGCQYKGAPNWALLKEAPQHRRGP